MQLVYRAVLTALPFPIAVWLIDPAAFELFARHSSFAFGSVVAVGLNAVVAYLVAPWCIKRCNLPIFGTRVAGDILELAVILVLSTALLWVECALFAAMSNLSNYSWLTVTHSFFGVSRIPAAAATLFGFVLSGPFFTWGNEPRGP